MNSSYLSQLKFDPRLARGIVAGYLGNVRIVGLVILGAVLFGLISFFNLNQRLNPEIDIPIVVVGTSYPGAAPKDVEQLITIPLERSISGVSDIKTLTSNSTQSRSSITIEFYTGTDIAVAKDEVDAAVSTVVSQLPEDATDPVIQDIDFENEPIWQFLLTAKSGDTASLHTLALELQEEIEDTPLINEVILSGYQRQEIRVEVSPETMSAYSIQPRQLASTIQLATQSLPGGSVESDSSVFTVAVDQTIRSIEDLRALPVTLREQTVPLGDIATISYASAPDQYGTYVIQDGQRLPAIQFSVYKNSSVDIVDAQQRVEEVVTAWQDERAAFAEISNVTEIAAEISDQFSELTSSFLTTIGLVFLTLLFFLGIRQAGIVSISIPITFLLSFLIMNMTGQSLNFLSLFSLLLALGLLLDDAIVIVSSMTAYYRTGKFSPLETGLLVWNDYIIPIWTTTLTTVWAFVPLLLASGIIGEFIKPIPVIVSSTLIMSTTVAVLIILPVMIVLLQLSVPSRVKKLVQGLVVIVALIGVGLLFAQSIYFGLAGVVATLLVLLAIRWKSELKVLLSNRKVQKNRVSTLQTLRQKLNTGFVDLDAVVDKYRSVIEKIITNKKRSWQVIIAVAIVSVFSYILLPAGFVKGEFFPADDSDVMYVGLELPNGASTQQTQMIVDRVLTTLPELPESERMVLEYGLGPVNPTGGGVSGDNTARLTVRLVPSTEREATSSQIVDRIRASVQDFTDASVQVYSPSGGPPAGADITIKLLGDEYQSLQQVADDIKSKLQTTEGVVNIDQSIKGSTSQLTFEPNQERIAELGLSAADISFWLRTAVAGYELDSFTLPDDTDETDIQLYIGASTKDVGALGAIEVITSAGKYPLAGLGTLKLQENPSSIAREDQKRTLQVTAEVTDGYSSPEINADVLTYVAKLELPDGVIYETGGANEENQNSINSILQAMVLSFVLIMATMVVQLGSFRKATIVLLVIPVAVSGVFLVFALTGIPLSFPALIGVLALFGIVVNNSIMVIEKINQNIAVGIEYDEAIIDGASSRLEPILFSSLTTILGLLPITLSDPIWQGLGGAIIAGLSVSGLVMLFFIPAVYALMMRDNPVIATASKQ